MACRERAGQRPPRPHRAAARANVRCIVRSEGDGVPSQASGFVGEMACSVRWMMAALAGEASASDERREHRFVRDGGAGCKKR
jgi:hypothetical protein